MGGKLNMENIRPTLRLKSPYMRDGDELGSNVSQCQALLVSHGMTQTQVAKLFGVTSAAVSQYLKGMRGGNNLIDRSAYKDDFYAEIARMADEISNGANVTESLCGICNFVKESGLLKALYVFEGYSGDLGICADCPRLNIVTSNEIVSERARSIGSEMPL